LERSTLDDHRQLKRHKFANALTLLVLGITLTLPAMLYFVSPTLQALATRSLQGESLTAYLSPSIDDKTGTALALQWQENNDIRETRYVPSDEALNLLRNSTDLGAAIDALGVNPLPGAIIVYPHSENLTQSSAREMADSFMNNAEVDRVQFDLQWVIRLRAVVALIQWVAGLMAAFLLITALLVITNTIRLETSRRRSEMQVATLLGASASFIMRPILYTGVLYGLLGGVIACFFASLVLHIVQQPANALSSLYNTASLLKTPDMSQFLAVIGISIALGIAGALATWFNHYKGRSAN